ncbi:MAG TPA: hypothetical protein VMD59_14485 [Acidimicrobiales bacterium]|nr:hypothetical protein [Acidimicrobiales bacterium]
MLPPSSALVRGFQQERERAIESGSRVAEHRPHRPLSVRARQRFSRVARLGAAAAVGGALAGAAVAVASAGPSSAQTPAMRPALTHAVERPAFVAESSRPAFAVEISLPRFVKQLEIARFARPAIAAGGVARPEIRALHAIHVHIGPDVF